MPLLIQKVRHLLGGVSQRPLTELGPSQLRSCDNWIARLTYGLIKRPPFSYVAKLTSSLTGIASAYYFAIVRDTGDKYKVVVRDGAINVYDASDGSAVTVEDRSAGSYLDAVAGKSYRAVTVGDSTYIVNQGVQVGRGTSKSANIKTSALVTVEQADFSTSYSIVLMGVTKTFTTVDQEAAASRGEITTRKIAEGLYDLLQADLHFLPFDFQLLGSTIYIAVKNFYADFRIDVYDGLGDNGLFLVKNEVESIEDLNRTRAPHGTKVKVLGVRGTDDDDYWVEYDATGSDPTEAGSWGIWKETLAPNTVKTIDPDTMPHRLTISSNKLGNDTPAVGAIAAPSVELLRTDEQSGGFTEDESGASITETDAQEVQQPGAGFMRLIPGADGTFRRAIVTYKVDTTDIDFGEQIAVNLYQRETGPSDTLIASRAHDRGDNGEYTFEVEGSWAATDRFRLIMGANTGVVSWDLFHRAHLSVEGSANEPIVTWAPDGVDITIPARTYRDGLVVAVTLSAGADVEFAYTVASGDTQDEVATGLAALINANGTYTASATGAVITVTVTADSTDDPEVVDAEVRFDTNTVALVLPDDTATITTDEWVGDTLENLTDGSEGTITANTADGKIVVSGFTGGVDNAASFGDLFRVKGAGTYFVFEPVDWEPRTVGDTTSNPWPSFMGDTISDVFFFQNRLGFLTGSNVVLSESGDKHNFFRTSVIDLLDGDVIDIASAHPEVADFQHSVVWNRNLFIWSDVAQYELSGNPVLTPKTVRFDRVSGFANSRTVPPLVVGRRIYFAHQQEGHVRLYEWAPPTDSEPVFQAIDVTKEVPTYMPGEVVDMAGDYGHGLVAVICDGDQDAVYIYSYADNPSGQQIMGAWQRATLPTGATARHAVFVDGKLSLVLSYAEGIFIEDGDYDQPSRGDNDQIVYVDRQVSEGGFLDFANLAGTAEDIVYTAGFFYHGNDANDFERYDFLNDLPGSDTWGATGGKYGPRMRIGFNAFGRESLRKKILTTPVSVGSASMYVKPIDTSAGDQEFFRIFDDTALKFNLKTDTAGPVVLEDYDGSTLATGSTSMTNTFRHIEVRWKLGASGYCKVWMDGTLEIDYSGALGDTSQWNSWGMRGSSSFSRYYYVSDVIIQNSESAQLGTSHRIWGALPDSDSGTNEWTPSTGLDHYALVDDTDPDHGTTYLTSTGAGDREEFGFAAPAVTGTIVSVTVKAMGDSDAAADDGLKLGMKLGANETLSAEIPPFILVGGTLYEDYQFVLTEKPGGGAWTAADLEDATILLESVSTNMKVTQVWIEVLTVGTSSEATTVFTLPYTPSTCRVYDTSAGAEVDCDADGAVVTVTGTYTESQLRAGEPWTATAVLAPPILRTEQGEPVAGGRAQVRYTEVEYNRTQDLKIESTPLGRSAYTKQIQETTLSEGSARVAVMANGADAIIKLISDGSGDARVSSLVYETFYRNRARRA